MHPQIILGSYAHEWTLYIWDIVDMMLYNLFLKICFLQQICF